MDSVVGDQPPPNSIEEPFIPLPQTVEGLHVLQSNRGIKSIPITKALLDSIVLPADLEEYLGVSKLTLANCYNYIQYEANPIVKLP